MKKQEKLQKIKELVEQPARQEMLTDEEKQLLIDRGYDLNTFLMKYKLPFIIFDRDNEDTADKIKAIAGKLDYPVIRFIHKRV
jgi:hypothetical protein